MTLYHGPVYIILLNSVALACHTRQNLIIVTVFYLFIKSEFFAEFFFAEIFHVIFCVTPRSTKMERRDQSNGEGLVEVGGVVVIYERISDISDADTQLIRKFVKVWQRK